MTKTYNPKYSITNTVLKKLEKIAQYQGKLSTLNQSDEDEIYNLTMANVDAVHFSTKLEGNQLTYEQVTMALSGSVNNLKSDRDLNEVINYSRVRQFLFEEAAQKGLLSNQLVLKAHKILLDKVLEGKLKGHYRDAQNVIKDASSGGITYLPPEAKDVSKLMKMLISWVNIQLSEETNPLIVGAIFHYFFVTIHPFMDGNGRLARLLTNFILISRGYDISKYAAIEKQHEQDRQRYYQHLRELQNVTFYDIPTDIDLSSWIEYWLDCMQKTYEEALSRIGSESGSPQIQHLDRRLQKAYSLFKKHKRLKASEYEALIGLGRTQAVADLNQLVDEGFIVKVGGSRSITYIIK